MPSGSDSFNIGEHYRPDLMDCAQCARRSSLLGNVAFSVMESLHPGTMWAGVDHSMGDERIDGVPTGNLIPENYAKRGGQSLSAFLGSVFGSTHHDRHGCGMNTDVLGARLVRERLPTTRWTEWNLYGLSRCR